MTDTAQLREADGLSWKYRLRLALVPVLARLGRGLGLSWRTLGFRLGREAMFAQLRAEGPAVMIDPAEKSLDVVFLTMMGGNHRLSCVEVMLGRALRARGHRVRYVLCDQVLPVCEVKWNGREDRWPRACAECYAFGRRLLEAAGCDVIPVSRLIEDAANEDDWTEYVDSALLKHRRVGVLEETDEVRRRRELFVRSARISAAAGEAVARMRPDRVVMSHGIYCTWGPARDVLLAADVPVLTYGEGKKKDTEKFNWSTSADWWDVSAEWERVKDTPLTDEQEARIDAYLATRRAHTQDARVYNFGEEEGVQDTRRRLRLDADKQTFVLFTNVLWDAASTHREIAFDNPVEWVMQTIRWFGEHPDKQLVVKIHPAEVVIGTNQPFASLIADRIGDLPDNVRVIEPHEQVNSWSILQVADLGLVHTSTVGMELPLEGVPCMVVSHTHYRGRGFTVDVDSRDEYFRRIENFSPEDVDREQLRTLAKRYAQILFERYQLPLPMLIESAVNDVRALDLLDGDRLLAHPTMKVFISAFENRTDFLLPAG